MGGFQVNFGLLRPVEDAYGQSLQRYAQLKALAQERDVRAQQLQMQQLQMQQQQIALENARQDQQDQQTMRQAYIDAGGDLDKTLLLAGQRGIGPKMITATQQSIAQMREAQAKLTKQERDNQDAANDQLHGLIQPVLNEKDPVKQKPLWDQALTQAVQSRLLTQEQANGLPYPGPDGVRNYGLALATTKWLTAQGSQQRGEAAIGGLHLREKEEAAKEAEKQFKDVVTQLGAQADQTGYDKKLAELGATVPYSILKRFEGGNPEKARLLGMTAAEQQKALKEPTEAENEAHWIATVNDPNASPADKAVADANLKRLVQQRKATQQPIGVTLMVPNQSGGFTAQRVAPGQSVGPGAVTVAGMNALTVPTAVTRTMAERAPRVVEFVDRINQLLDENEKQIGPLAGRWNEFTAGKIGLPNKGYTQIRTNTGLLQTMLMQMHSGRGSEYMQKHFQELIDSSTQSPSNLRAALAEIKDYAERVRQEGGPKGVNEAPQAMGGYQIGHVYSGQTYLGGDPNNGSNWRKAR